MIQKYLIFSLTVLTLSACSSTYSARSGNYGDDVYYSGRSESPTQIQEPAPVNNASPEDYTSTSQANSNSIDQNSGERFQKNTDSTTTSDGKTYITNNYYYDEDDYYDYAYSARIKRFHRPSRLPYYHTYYTNSYWYSHNPGYWGVSIYNSYPWWGPSYCVSYPFYYGYYQPYYGYSSYYGYYGSNYWYGYNHGYNNGYWAGYNHGYNDGHFGYNHPNYYNSYDNTNYYYGPRGGTSNNNQINQYTPQSLASTYTSAQQGPDKNLGRDLESAGKPMITPNPTGNPKGTIGSDNEVAPKPKPGIVSEPVKSAPASEDQPKGNTPTINSEDNSPSPKPQYHDPKGYEVEPVNPTPRPQYNEPKNNESEPVKPAPRPSYEVQPSSPNESSPYQTQPRPNRPEPQVRPKSNTNEQETPKQNNTPRSNYSTPSNSTPRSIPNTPSRTNSSGSGTQNQRSPR